MEKKEKEGVILVIICVFIHGASPILGKYGVSLVHPLFFAALTNLIAAAGLILIILYRSESIKKLINRKYFLSLLLIAFFGTTISNILFFYGVRITSGINSSILLQVEPIYALFIGYIILKEKVTFRQIIATTVIIFGTLLIIYQGTFSLNWGDLLVIGTPLCYQIGHIFSKRLLNQRELSPLFIAAGRTLYGGIFLFIISQVFGVQEYEKLRELNILGILVFYGLVIYGLTYYTFYESIKRINLSKATAIISAYPAVSILLAWFLLKEIPDFYQISGFLIILAGILYLSSLKSESRL
ncbi:MAG: DMT family transporter [Candidatus Caldatribacteriota bacterium]